MNHLTFIYFMWFGSVILILIFFRVVVLIMNLLFKLVTWSSFSNNRYRLERLWLLLSNLIWRKIWVFYILKVTLIRILVRRINHQLWASENLVSIMSWRSDQFSLARLLVACWLNIFTLFGWLLSTRLMSKWSRLRQECVVLVRLSLTFCYRIFLLLQISRTFWCYFVLILLTSVDWLVLSWRFF